MASLITGPLNAAKRKRVAVAVGEQELPEKRRKVRNERLASSDQASAREARFVVPQSAFGKFHTPQGSRDSQTIFETLFTEARTTILRVAVL